MNGRRRPLRASTLLVVSNVFTVLLTWTNLFAKREDRWQGWLIPAILAFSALSLGFLAWAFWRLRSEP